MTSRFLASVAGIWTVAACSITLATLRHPLSPSITQAALRSPHGGSDTERSDLGRAEVLSPSDLDRGLRMRVERMKTRRQSTRIRRQWDALHDYVVEDPPPDVDVPLPPDAPGGEISKERLEGR